MSGISPLEAVKLLEAQTMEHLDGEHLGSTGIATVAGNLGLSMEGATEAVESLRQRTVQMMEGQFGPPAGLSAGLLGAFVAGAIWARRHDSEIDHTRELCHAHGAYGPEGDCFVCDTQLARERAESAEAELVFSTLRLMGQKAKDFDLDLVTKFTDLDRTLIEHALDRLEDEDRVRAVVRGRDRPHWTLVID